MISLKRGDISIKGGEREKRGLGVFEKKGSLTLS